MVADRIGERGPQHLHALVPGHGIGGAPLGGSELGIEIEVGLLDADAASVDPQRVTRRKRVDAAVEG
ncbi:MAG: hypothetical protein ACK56F_08705, partial [bacterium]